jgi:hypothetical protein
MYILQNSEEQGAYPAKNAKAQMPTTQSAMSYFNCQQKYNLEVA